MKIESIVESIGNTPLLRIDPAVTGLRNIDLFAKLEMMNPIGASVKDRAAWAMLSDDIEDIGSRSERIVELSSGNTAKALAVLASMHGVPFKTVTSRMKIPEFRQLLLLLGAQLEELPGTAECVDPSDPEDPLAKAHRMLTADGSGYFHTDQYFNQRNVETHFQTTGPEIIEDLEGAPDHFIAGVGTAGTSTGVMAALRKQNDALNVVGVVSDKGDFLPGLRNADELKEVGLFDVDNYDSFEVISSDDAIDAMITLIRNCGVLCGPTAGAAFAASLTHLRRIDSSITQRQSAVFIVCDRVESYVQWIAKRRPDLVREPPRKNTVQSLNASQIEDAPQVDVEAASHLVEQGALVVDTRGSAAFQALHIEGSINILDAVLAEMLVGGLPFPPDRSLLLVCPVGEVSRKYAALLSEMGHREVHSMVGGIIEWRDRGKQLTRFAR